MSRISTNSFYANSQKLLNERFSDLAKLQDQISSGKKVQSAQDDPVGFNRLFNLKTNQNQIQIYNTNIQQAQTDLSLAEQRVVQMQDVMQGLLLASNQSQNPALAQTDVNIIASSVKGFMQDLAGVANSKDELGRSLFAGSRVDQEALLVSSTGSQYTGDFNIKQATVSATQTVKTGFTAQELLLDSRKNSPKMDIQTQALSSASTLRISVSGNAQNTPENISVAFTDNAGVLTATLTNNDTNTIISSQPYTQPLGLVIGNSKLTLTGDPVAGDSVSFSKNANLDPFAVASRFEALLKNKENTPNNVFANSMEQIGKQLEEVFNNLVVKQSLQGVQGSIVQRQQNTNSLMLLEMERERSQIEDVDLTAVVSEFVKQQTALDAARSTFQRISANSLFDFIR